MPFCHRRIRLCVLVSVAVVAVILSIMHFVVPTPLVSHNASFPIGEKIVVWRWGDNSEFYEIDDSLANDILIVLQQYSAVPRFTQDRYPRMMSKIPFELEFMCIDGGPKHFVLGEDFFWYGSSNTITYSIQDGPLLLNEIVSLLEPLSRTR